jgi:bifunctional UDP-N-acetylglucosamine pyrophosphorylase/glucosamine-1-phosphate N-acetyltransferase
MHNLTEAPTISAEPARVDHRTTPEYFFDTEQVHDPVLLGLLSHCPTVFGFKKAISDLLAGRLDIALPAAEGVIEPGATGRGNVIVADGAVIAEGAHVTGPVLVCPGARIEAGARVRDNCVIGPGCQIGFGAEVTRSLLLGGVFMKHTSFVGDSVLGLGVNIGAFVSTTGLRVTSGPVTEPATDEVSAHLDGHRIGTGQTKFGAVVGDGVILPAGTVLRPATLIGAHTVLYPKTQIGGFFPAGSQGR